MPTVRIQILQCAGALLLAVCLAGCMRDQTRQMVDTCQHLLDAGDRSASRNFLADADAHLAELGQPGALARRVRAALDPDAEDHVGPLQQCVWRLRHEQGG